jgi:hypothetical protein
MKSNSIPQLCIVQFPHPGPERGRKNWHEGLRVPWNARQLHRRKFLVSSGRYVDESGSLSEGELVFWGEWEPPSYVIEKWKKRPPLPTFLHRPVWQRRKPTGAQNTDPWVFGKCFRYSNCHQLRKSGKIFLQDLSRGSLILFGSVIGKSFILDTVFVVKDSKRYKPGKPPASDKAFQVCTLETLGPSWPLTLYDGVTYEDRNDFNGMYSFVPCRRRDSVGFRFKRPAISIRKYINPKSWQTPSHKQVDSEAAIREVWDNVRTQVLRHCVSGISFSTPRLEKGSDSSARRETVEHRKSGGCGGGIAAKSSRGGCG